MRDLKVGVAAVVSFGTAQDKTDGVTLETGLVSALDHGSTGIKLSKNGGAMTIRHATVTASTYDSYGQYLVTLDTTDINTLGHLKMLYVDEATNLPMEENFNVITADEWDRKYATTGPVPDMGIKERGTAQSATSTTLVGRSAQALADDVCIGDVLMAYGSTQGYWQSRVIDDYVESTKTYTVKAWTVTPSGTIAYRHLTSAPAGAALQDVNVLTVATDALTAAAAKADFIAKIHAGQLDGFIAWLQDGGFVRPATTGNATLKNSAGSGQTVAVTTGAAETILSAT